MSTVFTIGSFNMRDMGMASSKDYGRIVDIICKEKFDVVAMQEVLDYYPLKVITDLLSNCTDGKWDYRQKRPDSISIKASEGYGFIWNTSRLELVEPEKYVQDENPKIMNEYKISNAYEYSCGQLLRPPYVARFRVKACFQEIRLINTHILCNKPQSLNTQLKAPELRRAELLTLAKEIYIRVAQKRYGTNTDAITILLGDYNLSLVGTKYRINNIIEYDSNKQLLIVQDDKTTLKQIKNDLIDSEENASQTFEDTDNKMYEEGENDFYASDFDHFAYDSKFEESTILVASRVEVMNNEDEFKSYSKHISDHVPIKLEIDFNKRQRRI